MTINSGGTRHSARLGRWRFFATILFAGLGACQERPPEAATVPGPTATVGTASTFKRYTVQRDYAIVREDLEIAIANQGLVIDHISHIADMLERTGKDLGQTQQLYAKGETFLFCSASLSREMMAADPRNVVFCPYAIALYILPQEPRAVHIAYRIPRPLDSQGDPAVLTKVEKLLDTIAREAGGLGAVP